jgi:hypothetical protein
VGLLVHFRRGDGLLGLLEGRELLEGGVGGNQLGGVLLLLLGELVGQLRVDAAPQGRTGFRV